ncbi:PH domain-containing protein [Ornithinimicrobium flavum]|uniref:PH domain-containing protein n=1 Tax=Ornithinimicrobium flavum TaxID=1288636 RepID=UPI003B83884A
MARIGSSADHRGIEVTQLRTRRFAWSVVEELRPNAASRWATSVEARLTDGTTVPLPGVPVADLRRLEELRASEARPSSPGY